MERALRKLLPRSGFKVSQTRSSAMSAVRGKNNRTTERRLRLALVRAEMRGWTMHPKDLSGSPDFFFRTAGVAVFVDGCFWHACPMCGHVPRANNRFWQAKLQRNRERDARVMSELLANKLRVLRFWEHELADDLTGCIKRIRTAVSKTRKERRRATKPVPTRSLSPPP
jgi:DNA mismatch endonuclease, patch repair protein